MSRSILLGISLMFAGCSLRTQGKSLNPPEPPAVTRARPVIPPVWQPKAESPTVTLDLPVLPSVSLLKEETRAIKLALSAFPPASLPKAELPTVTLDPPVFAPERPKPEPTETTANLPIEKNESQRETGLRNILESTYYLTAGPLLLLTTIALALCMRNKAPV